MGKREQEVFSVWRLVTSPAIRDLGLQNVLLAMECERKQWQDYEVEAMFEGLNKIYELTKERSPDE